MSVGGAVGPAVLRVIEPGVQSTVQDLGRFGYQRVGVPPSGAADQVAAAAANAVVGNTGDAAVVEITAGSAELECLARCVIALGGAQVDAHLEPAVEVRSVPSGVPVPLGPGERLRLGPPERGFRTYLAIRGGVDVPLVLGSRSTYLAAAFGGHDGRALRAGDELHVGDQTRDGGVLPASGGAMTANARSPIAAGTLELPFIPSGQWDRAPAATREAFIGGRWTVSYRSDRMGLRLEGEPLPGAAIGRGFVSDGTVTGAIQISGDGLPIVLGVDRQTTGGYPKLGAVASAVSHLLGQLQPGDEVTFRPVSIEAARRALRTGAAP
jgi:antagonist of KipI